MPKQEYNIQDYLDSLLKKIEPYEHIDRDVVKKAFVFAADAHDGQLRKSGEPYIMHPCAVAEILLDHYQDEKSVLSALLHDTIEDTTVTFEDVKNHFGADVAFIVDSLSHFDQATKSKDIKDIQTLKKILLSMNKDFRVIHVKLADRLHNMKTLKFMPPDKQQKKALEAQKIYVGLAKSLNLWSWKKELDDLCLQYLDPEIYKTLNKNIDKKIKEDYDKIESLMNQTKEILTPMNGNLSSIKLIKHSTAGVLKALKGNTHPNITDIYHIDINMKDKYKCYLAMAKIHENFKMFNTKSKDHFSIPKENGYRALHTTIFSNIGLVDIKIKTKEKAISQSEQNELSQKITLREKNLKDPIVFKESIIDEVFNDNMRVYSSLGGEKNLPEGSTILDFLLLSYGKKALFFAQIQVNSKVVNWNHTLKHNDMIEMIFADSKRPIRLEWFDALKSYEAKHILKESIGGEEAYENLLKGYEEFKYWQEVFDIPSLDFIYKHLEDRVLQRYNSFEFALIDLGKENIFIKEFLSILIPIEYFRNLESNVFSFALQIGQVDVTSVAKMMQLLLKYLASNLPSIWANNYDIADDQISLNLRYHFVSIGSLLDFLIAMKNNISTKLKLQYVF